jgi:hypothetical protein
MKPIFSRNLDIDKIAFLNWRFNKETEILNLLNIADGFMQSSIELAKVCLTDNDDKKADIVIFPILANANHGIELYLKSILWMLNRLLKIDSKIEGRHNIKQIYSTILSRLKIFKGHLTLKEFNKETKELKNYIEELVLKIDSTIQNDKMDFSRYPFSNKYENHFYVDTLRNVEIDLENFVLRFSLIHDKLEHISSFLYHHESNTEEFNI